MYNRYLVTGATGFLGRTVVAQLLEKGASVSALTLENDPLAGSLPQEVHAVAGNVCDESSLEAFFEGADGGTCVIHCAGIVSVASDPGERIYRVNVGGTRNILRKCVAHGVGKLVYVSSVHALPEKPKGTEISEKTVIRPGAVKGDYAKSKAMATVQVLNAAKEGLNASIVFPSGIIGPGDTMNGSITNMLRSFLAGKLPLAIRGGYDFVDVRDVAKGIADCAESGLPGRGYILSGHYATIRDILETVKKTVGLRWRVSYLPVALAKLVAPFYEIHSLRKRKPLYFTPYAVAVLDSNGLFSHRAASETFGYAPRSLQSTLHDTVLWLQQNVLTPAAA